MFSEEPKELLYIWATFGRKFVAKNFQKSPNLVTLPLDHHHHHVPKNYIVPHLHLTKLIHSL